jgi:hypothetical protein
MLLSWSGPGDVVEPAVPRNVIAILPAADKTSFIGRDEFLFSKERATPAKRKPPEWRGRTAGMCARGVQMCTSKCEIALEHARVSPKEEI